MTKRDYEWGKASGIGKERKKKKKGTVEEKEEGEQDVHSTMIHPYRCNGKDRRKQ